jgi:alkanesulfonate monooxygenase SsuD/methylene tetrahydromethanopterin reductase-like flavin-dependent oxidoreductase (luciferase family)
MSRLVRVGVQLPEVEREIRWPEVAAIAQAAEEVGFDSVWVGDHYLYRGDGRSERGPWEAWTQLAGLAAATRRVGLGPLVACAGFHDAAVLAKMAATVDEIAGGRLTVALGAGWNRTEFDAFGIDFDRRVSRFEESFTIVRRLLAGERVTFEGRWHRTEDAVLLPAPTRRARLMLGSTSPRMLSIALPHVDAWNTWFDDYANHPDGFAALRSRVDVAAEAAGRDPATLEASACLLVAVDPSAGERPHDPSAPPVTGSPEVVAATIREMAEAGADEVILVLDPITEASVRSLAGVLASLEG